MVSGQSFGSCVVCIACITSMCSVQHFPCGHSLHLAFGSFFYPIPPTPFILPLINQCDRCLVPLACRLLAGGHGFASHRGVTLSSSCAIGGSPWTSQAPTSTSNAVVSIGSVHLHWCHFLAVDWVGLCRCVTNADWRLADCRVNQVRIVVKCFYRFPILKLESSKSLV